MTELLKEHLNKYPQMQPQDGIKLLFQASFGGAHLISDKEKCLAAIKKEWSGKQNINRFENLGENYVRANINAFEKEELPFLCNLFIKGAKPAKEPEILDLSPVKEVFKDGEAFLSVYLKEGIRPVSHSEIYRQEYKPAYRVIPKKYADYWDILWEIHSQAPSVIAIDGRAGSGKTTLANIISEVFECDIVRADDFFLPPALRTPERLSEPGGNIHYERLKEQVIENLGTEFEYDVFDCSVMSLNGKRKINSKGMCVMEGSYSMHPYFGKYYDMGLFVTVDTNEQERRILKRNGENMLKMFKEKWIPMEEKYISFYETDKKGITVHSV